MAPFFYVT